MNKSGSCKVCKSVQVKLFLKGKKCFTSSCPFERKEKRERNKRKFVNKKPYSIQMIEKRKVLARYNITFSQLKKYFVISKKKFLNLDSVIESRLDNLVYRSGFVPNIRTGRQMITHGFVKVNDTKCNIPSRILNKDDTITIYDKRHVFHLSEKPSWIHVDGDSIKLIETPKSIENFINFKIVSEFLSRYV